MADAANTRPEARPTIVQIDVLVINTWTNFMAMILAANRPSINLTTPIEVGITNDSWAACNTGRLQHGPIRDLIVHNLHKQDSTADKLGYLNDLIAICHHIHGIWTNCRVLFISIQYHLTKRPFFEQSTVVVPRYQCLFSMRNSRKSGIEELAYTYTHSFGWRSINVGWLLCIVVDSNFLIVCICIFFHGGWVACGGERTFFAANVSVRSREMMERAVMVLQ